MEAHEPLTRVLLVDDELEFLDATARALSRRGCLVRTEADGASALEALEQDDFDVVVLDVRMPGLDGVEVFERIRARDPGLPVIMLTGHGSLDQACETSRSGVFDYLAKPCDVSDLAAVVHRAVGGRRRSSAAPELTVEGAPVRVLLVDDEPDVLAALSPALQRRGLRVATAPGGVEALESLRRERFDVVVTDLRMPGMDGMDLLRAVRELDQTVEVIILTGHPTVDRAIGAMRDGAFDFLVKPQPIGALVSRIHDAWRARQRRVGERQEQVVREVLERIPD